MLLMAKRGGRSKSNVINGNEGRDFLLGASKPARISFEGNIGVGKSTILKLLQSHPLPQQNAYLFQSFLFTTRFLRQNAAASQSKAALLLMERSVLTDRCVFVEIATEQGYFNPLEVTAYDAWYDDVVAALPNVVPDAFIYLRADPNVCSKRLKERYCTKSIHEQFSSNDPMPNAFQVCHIHFGGILKAQSEEIEVSLEYLQSIHSKHEKWFIESAFNDAENWGGKSQEGCFSSRSMITVVI